MCSQKLPWLWLKKKFHADSENMFFFHFPKMMTEENSTNMLFFRPPFRNYVSTCFFKHPHNKTLRPGALANNNSQPWARFVDTRGALICSEVLGRKDGSTKRFFPTESRSVFFCKNRSAGLRRCLTSESFPLKSDRRALEKRKGWVIPSSILSVKNYIRPQGFATFF